MADVFVIQEGSKLPDGTEQIEIPVKYVANGDGSYTEQTTELQGRTIDISDGAGVILASRLKSFSALVTGTGSVTADISIQFRTDDEAAWVELLQFILSGTGSDHYEQVVENSFSQYRAVISNLTGTGAACVVKVSV